MLDFLATLLTTLQQSNVQLAIFMNGSLEADRFQEWRSSQMHLKDNVRKVLRHVHKRGTPPPKAWWVPPCAIQTMLRYALRTLNCSVVSKHYKLKEKMNETSTRICLPSPFSLISQLNSIDDHRQEVISFCWENGYHGVMADDSEYAMFSPPRFFSAHALKMTFQYEVTTIEYVLDEMAKSLDLNPNRFCLLGALLGNHILPSKELKEFHMRLAPPETTVSGKHKVNFDRVIRAVVNYIRSLPKIDDFERIGTDVFGSDKDPRIKKLKSSMNYYQSMSQEGYTKHKPKHNKKNKKHAPIKLATEIEEQEEKKKNNNNNNNAQNKVRVIFVILI